MSEVILGKPNSRGGFKNESRKELHVASEVKVEKNPQTKHRKRLTEDEFYSIIQELRKEGFSLIADIVIGKEVPLEERRKEAEKPLYLARYE